ncbi:MAG TPA: L-dopachrome tautomerase-related protein [Kofleriaceae bacterium]|nr:L-dopachrome tautomerase-related protein [Kofleriaceae bacterium]
MTRWMLSLAALAGCGGSLATPTAPAPAFGRPELVYAWTRVAYDFPSADAARAYERDGVYEKTLLAGVDIDRRGRVFVTTPRWLDARVPATLSEVVRRDGKPVLRPFPSWQANDLGDPRALRSVLGVDVDSRNRMWILDMGWVAGIDPTPDGAQKLVVIDLDTGRELARYAFPDDVADRKTSFLNDLAVDERRGVAYISDSGNRAGSPTASGIIIYSLADNRARRVLDRDPHVQDDPARTLYVEGERVLPGGRLAVGINGIALSPDGARLYWSITTGDAIYDAPTRVLLDPRATPQQIAAAIHGPRRIGGGSDGLAADDRGRIYATNLGKDEVDVLDPATGALRAIASGPDFAWPDSLTWDDRGGLYISTNHLNRGFAGAIRFDGPAPNFRIFRIQTDAHKGFVR